MLFRLHSISPHKAEAQRRLEGAPKLGQASPGSDLTALSSKAFFWSAWLSEVRPPQAGKIYIFGPWACQFWLISATGSVPQRHDRHRPVIIAPKLSTSSDNLMWSKELLTGLHGTLKQPPQDGSCDMFAGRLKKANLKKYRGGNLRAFCTLLIDGLGPVGVAKFC